MTHRSTLFAFLVFAQLAMTVASAEGQIGQTTDLITGVVVGADGEPLPNVTVEALSLETQIARTTTTDERGRYTILFPDGGGQYRMTARMIGLVPRQAVLARYADEDRLVWNVDLSRQTVQLEGIEVVAFLTPVRVPDRPSPGDRQQNLTPDQLANLPIDVDDLNTLAVLAPGVVTVDATDSTGASYSVAGLREDANAITLDGMTFSSGQVPQEGLRSTRVITSTYDVSRGRFSGGLIASTSRSGTNQMYLSGSYSMRDDELAFESGEASPYRSAHSQHYLGVGAGGPIRSNRLFAFASMQGRLRTDRTPNLTVATTNDLTRLGVSPDSVARFVTLADQLGASPDLGVDDDRSNDNLSAMLRLDYLVSMNHTLTVRGDWRGASQDPTRVGTLSLPETGGTMRTSGGGVMASLASRVGLSVINEARAYVALDDQAGEPYLALPQGRVQVASDLSDGQGIANLTLGGNPGLPQSASSRFVEVANELSWLPGTGTHRIKLGGVITAERSDDRRSSNQFGIFTYNSLADLEAGTPNAFRRTLTPDERSTESVEYAVYAGDVWRASPVLQLTYGMRFEGSALTGAPPNNPALETTFGRRTDRLPSDLALSPRAGFTYTVGSAGFGTRPDLVVRGGAGLFRSPLPTSLVALAQASTGLADADLEVNCIGASVPAPDWSAYVRDANTIPATCVGPSTPLGTGAPNAAVFSDDFSAPMAWRASLGVQRSLTALIRVSVDGVYARGTNQYGFADLNLNTAGGFGLSAEAARPVFVDPSRISRRGAINLADSRLDPTFAQVYEIDSDLASETKQLTVGVGGITRRGIVFNTSYTWSSVRDQSSTSISFGRGGGGRGRGAGRIGLASTAGDPNVPEWSRGAFERRHSFLLTVSYPFGTNLEVTGFGRILSGAPYTPMVASDINGDGTRNDRAFVFDPVAASPEVARGLDQLLANASAGARDCLTDQLGRFADRNSCRGPWQGTFDMQMNWRPQVLGLDRFLSVSISTMNLLRGVDDLIHGSDNAKGWGDRSRPDQNLLFVTGFDPVTRNFMYQVNERFGATNAGARALVNPFQIGVQARLSLGPNRQRDALDRLRGGGGRRGGGGFGGGLGGGRGDGGGRGGGGGLGGGRILAGLGDADFVERFLSLQPNPGAIALRLADSLGLSDEQRAAVTAIRDSLTAQNEILARELQVELDAAGTNQDPRALLRIIQPTTQGARANAARSLEELRGILSDEQWEMLPDNLRNFRNRAGRGRRRGS